jgi:hypothetical protein
MTNIMNNAEQWNAFIHSTESHHNSSYNFLAGLLLAIRAFVLCMCACEEREIDT